MGNFRDVKWSGDITSAGKKRGNGDNWNDNFVKFPASDTMDEVPKLYKVVLTAAAGQTIDQITLDGTTYTLSTAVDADAPSRLGAIVNAIIEAHTPEVLNPVLVAQYDSVADETTIFYVATNVLTSVKPSGGSAVEASVLPDVYLETAWYFTVDPAGTGITILSDAGSADFAGHATAATTKTNIEAALAAGPDVTHYGVVVTAVSGEDHDVVVYVEGRDRPFTVEGLKPTFRGSRMNFKA